MLFRQSRKPTVIYQDTAFNSAVVERCPILGEMYRMIPWLWNGHMETLFATLFRRHPRLKYNRQLVRMDDGGLVALDFEPLEMDQGLTQDSPVLLILPGLTGGSTDSYVRYTLKAARELGIRGIVFNYRGVADSPVVTPKLYSASHTGDFRSVVQHVKEWYPEATLLAAGFSVGGNLLVNYLGEEGAATPLAAAASLCNPFNLNMADSAVSRGFTRLYTYVLGRRLGQNFARCQSLFADLEGIDVQKGARPSTIREYDHAVTIHDFKWESVTEYYRGSSSDQRVHNVRIPLMCIQAEDDVLALADAIPHKTLHQNEHCILVRTPGGGHLGWVRRDDIFGGPWSDLLLKDYLAAVLEHKRGNPN